MDLKLEDIKKEMKHGVPVSFMYKGREFEDAKIIIEEDDGEQYVYIAQDFIPSPTEPSEKFDYKFAFSIGWVDDLRLNLTGVKITRIGNLNKKRDVKKGMKITMRGSKFVIYDIVQNIVFLSLESEPEEIARKHDIKLVLAEAIFDEDVVEVAA